MAPEEQSIGGDLTGTVKLNMPAIPPPPPPPSPETEPAPEHRSRRETLFPRLKKWGGVVSAVIALLGAGATVWKTIAYIEELRTTIGANKTTVNRMLQESQEAHRELQNRVSRVAVAVRAQHDQDQEVITNLRIAVAALQASQAVREGRISYGGVQGLGSDGATLAMAARPPSTQRGRQAQSEAAQEDAAEALDRAEMIQHQADPMAALEGL